MDILEKDILVGNRVVRSFSEILLQWQILRYLLLQLCSDGFTYEQRVFHLLYGCHDML